MEETGGKIFKPLEGIMNAVKAFLTCHKAF